MTGKDKTFNSTLPKQELTTETFTSNFLLTAGTVIMILYHYEYKMMTVLVIIDNRNDS